MRVVNLLFFSLFVVTFLHAQVATNKVSPCIIILIGDGMGLSQITAGYYLNGDKSVFDNFNSIGLIRTHSKSNKFTDSAAASTAFATGQKTYNGAIGMDVDTNAIANLTELLSSEGYATGLISISSVTDATPAGFYAHVKDRDLEEDIAAQLPTSGIDFISGGGYKFFASRADSLNLIKQLEDNNFIVDSIQNFQQKLTPSNRYAFLVSENGMPKYANERNNFLSLSLKQSLDYFADKQQPFFVMAEGSNIDWAGHNNDAEFLLEEQLDFQKAVEVGLEFVKNNPNTLLIVTGDHETGAVALQKGAKPDEISITFGGKHHTAVMLPVFTFGKCAESFQGIYENTDIFKKIFECINN